MTNIKFIDLFCGIGGFHHAIDAASKRLNAQSECVFASDIDEKCQLSYAQNFGLKPNGDITAFDENKIPTHDILLAGFPCQAFSIIGEMQGFADTRGTLFFDVARILKVKMPKFFVLENVKQLVGHDKGLTLATILKTCTDIGYDVQYKVLNALDFGLPQKRERVFIVGSLNKLVFDFDFDLNHIKKTPLSKLLENNVDPKYLASQHIRNRRQQLVKREQLAHGRPTIWHENKNGNISAYEHSCALRAAASYNYLLVNGERRLTEREMLSLQGFPLKHKIVGSYSDLRKQTGNALPIPMASEVIFKLIKQNLNMGESDGNTKVAASIGSKASLST
jgi:DNA (cytosine-5)-methyltransferase 1